MKTRKKFFIQSPIGVKTVEVVKEVEKSDEMADEEQRLAPYLGPAGAWAIALGTSIGWGSLSSPAVPGWPRQVPSAACSVS